MSGAEEEPTGSDSKPMSTKHRSERGRRSKQKEELNEDQKKELLRQYAETDQNLEKFAQAHNMTAINVKSVLRSVIKNHRALARVLGTDTSGDSIDGVRITRSKTRALQNSSNQGVDMNLNVPIRRGHSWHSDLNFNEDDDYDNDYNPGEDDCEDDIETESSGSSDDEESDISELEEEEGNEHEDYEQNQTLANNHSDESMRELGLKPNEIQCRYRPDSAARLTLNAMIAKNDEQSSSFWPVFLNNNMIDENEEENGDDPDYMVDPDSIFRDDQDDEMNYWTSIPQREVEDLFVDILPSEKLEEMARNLSPPLRQMETVKEGTIVEMSAPTPNRVPVEKERKEVVEEKIFTSRHRRQLRAQMEQHVQLLTQSFVGCYFEPLLQEEKEKARLMIESLSEIASCTGHLADKSAFHIPNLPSAIETCNGMREKTLENPVKPLAKEELTIPHPILSITKEVLSSSEAIVYPHLVSRHRLVQSIGNSGWNQNEVVLYGMAYNRYAEAPAKHRLPRQSKYSIIAVNSMPWRTMDELRWVYNGMKRGLERNGKTKHNEEFFEVAEGVKKMTFPRPLRARKGWTMHKWPKKTLPKWFSSLPVKRKSLEMIKKEKESSEPVKKKMRKERRIEEGDDENEPIVILDDGEEGELIEIDEEREKEESNDKEKGEKTMTFSLDDDECAMDSMGKCGMEGSPDEIEAVRGEESGGGEGQPIDFSHLMSEMSPQRGPSRLRISPKRARSPSPNEKSFFPPTPGKRFPSPLEESMPWLNEMPAFGSAFDSPPRCTSPPTTSRIKTPGGTMDYVDSLIGYFGTPEREMKGMKEGEAGVSISKRHNAYSNLFGDFDFDESDDDEEMTSAIVNEEVVERKEEEERPESVTASAPIEEKAPTNVVIIPVEVPVKQRKKRTTREEKEKIGLAAIKDVAFRRRVKCALAKKAYEDIRAMMTMHSSRFKQIESIFSQTADMKERAKLLKNLVPMLSEHHREVLYLLSAFAPPSILPRSLLLSQGRQTYLAAINMMCTIYAYMTKIQRRLSYRQLLRIIVDAHTKGGTEKVLDTLKDVLVNDPLLLRVLSEYHTPAIPSKKSRVWESIDLRKGDEAFNLIKENARTERVDLCEVMGAVPTKKMLTKKKKPLSTLLINHDGEPVLRNKDGKYKEIAVMSEHQMEEEWKNKVMEKEEEKKAKQREKREEKKEAAKKAKMVERREERAREKKKEMERRQKEEEMKKEQREAPPTHPFNRDMDKALLMLYNEVQKVTKRAVRKMAADIPYSTNFTMEQLQSRLDFLLAMAKNQKNRLSLQDRPPTEHGTISLTCNS